MHSLSSKFHKTSSRILRYVVLGETRIFCYKNQVEEIDLAIHNKVENNSPNSFVLKPSSEQPKPIQYNAKTANDTKQWIQGIHSAHSALSNKSQDINNNKCIQKPSIKRHKPIQTQKIQQSQNWQKKLKGKDEEIGTLRITLNTQNLHSNIKKLERIEYLWEILCNEFPKISIIFP